MAIQQVLILMVSSISSLEFGHGLWSLVSSGLALVFLFGGVLRGAAVALAALAAFRSGPNVQVTNTWQPAHSHSSVVASDSARAAPQTILLSQSASRPSNVLGVGAAAAEPLPGLSQAISNVVLAHAGESAASTQTAARSLRVDGAPFIK